MTTVATRARVLFVDDEVAILDGLRDILRKERHRWDMQFVTSSAQALEVLEQGVVDIVVSDMRMPGMDGAELLTRVKSKYPAVTRIVLSGYADRDAVMRALPVAHQFLSKPCQASLLRATIDRTHALRQLVERDAVRTLVGRLDRLPSVPRTYLALTQLAADPSKGIGDLATLVESDQAMSAKVLQLVSSAYFGSARNITSIKSAVGMLGVDLMRGLALSANAFSAMAECQVPGFSIEQLQLRSTAAAHVAKTLLAQSARQDEAFTAALVHGIGMVVTALSMPGELAQALAESTRTRRPLHVVEQELYGADHCAVGAYLLGVWGLPLSIVEAVAFHHEPSRVKAEGPLEVLAAVHVASTVVDQVLGGVSEIDETFLRAAGFAVERERWRTLAEAAVKPIDRRS